MGDIDKHLDHIKREFGSIEAYVAQEFGDDVPFSVAGDFCLIHLDRPEPWKIEQRVAKFDPKDHFPDDCPICEMEREMGGFIVYDNDEDQEDLHTEPDTHSEPSPPLPNGIWRRSYMDLKSLSDVPPEIRASALIQTLWGNLVELKEDAQESSAHVDKTLRDLKECYHLFAKEAFLLLNSKQNIMWTEIKPLYDAMRQAAERIDWPLMAEKISDMKERVQILGSTLQEIIIRRSFN